MSKINFTIGNSIPVNSPFYDPRLGVGIDFYVNATQGGGIWVGLSTTGSERWGELGGGLGFVEALPEAEVGNFIVADPVVTTSNSEPSEYPQYVPSEGRVHFHVSYFPNSTYCLYIGISKDQERAIWASYGFQQVI